ncbi:MAG TPA: TonB-dependent receptor [Rhodanobacteraceae bacterium]
MALSAALALPLAVMAQPAVDSAAGTAPAVQTTTDNAASTQSDQTPPAKTTKKAVQLQSVKVLGSLIPRVQIEGAAPVQVITGAQIQAQGYTTVFQFLQSLPQTSGNSDFYNRPSTWGNTAVNARTINLRNLGPQFTLLMVDGQRVVPYPQAENASFGHFAIQNANNIPIGMVDQVQVLATGASAMYGSRAMAGVINIILKKHYQGDEVNVKVGHDTRGGQKYGDINLFGGHSGSNWSFVYNLEHSNRAALYGSDRPDYDGVDDAGYQEWNASDRLFGYQYDAAGATGISLTGANGNYIAPPAGSCGAFKNFRLAESTTIGTSGDKVTGPITHKGQYCAQPAVFRNWVLEPGFRSNNGFAYGQYDFTPNLTAYASAAVYITHGWSQTQLPGYGFGTPFYDAGSDQVITHFSRQLTQAEIGSMAETYDNEKYWDLRAGLKGGFMDDQFDWNLRLDDQKYLVHENYTAYNIPAMQNFFLGQQQGTKTVNGVTYPVYTLNQKALWNPITTDQYNTFGAYGQNNAVSELKTVAFNINGDLFTIPWTDQPVGWGAVVEGDWQLYSLRPDPRTSSSDFEDPFGDFNQGHGTRRHYAVASEFSVPIVKTLTWDIAGRVDKYNDISKADIARTWKTGLEWRPLSWLLLRGTYGTNFEAPSLNSIYLTGSSATVGDYADPLNCIKTHNTACSDYQHPTSEYFNNLSGGDPDLTPMTGKSWTAGFVVDIPQVQGLSFQADYWNLQINNEIVWIGLDQTLNDEAGCLTGLTPSGAPYTDHVVGSAYCQEAIANVTRDANGQITAVHTGPINESYQQVSGVDGAINYTLRTASAGAFRFQLNYTNNLSWKSRTLATDPLINTRYQHVASRITGSLAWHRGPWNVTLYGLRWGSVRDNNYAGCQTLPNGISPSAGDASCVPYLAHIKPWIIWSTNIGYQFTKKFKATLTVHNLFDRIGAISPYAGGFEFVNGEQGQDYTGRQVFLSVNYKID